MDNQDEHGENHEEIRVEGPRPEAATTVPWEPRVGEEVTNLLERKLESTESRIPVRAEAIHVLTQCVPPAAPTGRRTGLVVGYVQSGKTLSFTAVAALANDNRYRTIIVLSGTKTNLAEQSRDRLVEDLALEETPFSRWVHFHNPTTDVLGRIRDVLQEWDDPRTPENERRTVLITLLKNYSRLQDLVELLDELGGEVACPALVIDDEADQASLNNLVRDGQLSTTYRWLLELRDRLPSHTFLQYTATPQGVLLINLIDVLSPDFGVVLTPGEGYVGGAVFFGPGSAFVEEIPLAEIGTPNAPLVEPPPSLLRSLRLFLVGVASGLIRRSARPRNRSMLIHPGRERDVHYRYFTWVQAARELWVDLLSRDADPAAREAVLGEFREAYDDIATSVPDLESFEDIVAKLPQAIRQTDVRVVNSLPQANREIRWRRNYSWILIGGEVLNRGFTVEGLTVTYMPRNPGVGNADTIQQRARFLGYKRSYIGYCRVLVHPLVANAYRVYVRHEEDVRRRLAEHVTTGRPLPELRRAFLLDRALRPTRQSIHDVEYARPSFRGGWFFSRSPQLSSGAVQTNRRLFDDLVRDLNPRLEPDPGHPDRTEHQRHELALGLPLQDVYRRFLTELRITDFEDSQRWTAALILIDAFLEDHPDAVCAVYRMRPRVVTRRQVRDQEIVNLFQGAHPDRDGRIYPGDRRLRHAPVTIQLHRLTLVDGPVDTGPVVAQDVPAVAVWMGNDVLADIIVQEQEVLDEAENTE